MSSLFLFKMERFLMQGTVSSSPWWPTPAHHHHHLDLVQAFSQLVLIHLLNLRFTKLQAEKEKICSKDVLRSMKNHLNLWRQSPQQLQPSLLKNQQFPQAHLRCCLELTSRRLKMSLKNFTEKWWRRQKNKDWWELLWNKNVLFLELFFLLLVACKVRFPSW